MKKRILAIGIVLGLITVLAVPMAVLAGHQAGQGASTAQATSITIVGKTATSTAVVSTITFPEGSTGAVISDPYSDAVGAGEATPQLLDAASSKPVVQLKNGSVGTLKVWLAITAWTDAVASERYELSDPLTTTTSDLSGATALTTTSTDTGSTIGADAYLALYLEVTLSASAGASGTSTLTVLGET